MKIGMLTGLWYIAEGATVLESLERTAALGFRYVDLHGVFHAGPQHLTLDERREVRARLETLGLEPRNYVLHALHNPASASDSELEQSYRYLCEGIDLAQSWGVNQIMLNAGQWSFGISREQAWARAASFIQRVCDYAIAKDVYIAQEPEPYVWFLVNDMASAARMIESVARPNFTTLIDLGHMALSRENIADLDQLGGRIIHAHFSDHETYRHTNQIIGTGFTPTAQYLAGLRQNGVDKLAKQYGYDDIVVSFELGVPGDKITDPDTWARQSLEYIRQVAPFMGLS